MVFLDWEFIALCRRHRARPRGRLPRSDLEEQRCSPGQFVSRGANECFSRSSQKCEVSVVLAVSMSIRFDRCRKISKSAINELPEGNNFEGEDIIFALFSPIESLLSLHPALATVAVAAAGPEVIGGERRRSIGNDAFCPVMNYVGGGRRYREMRRRSRR